jgi:hypothetical protein
MSDRRDPAGPPAELPAALLADLDAGLLDSARAAEVRAAAARDPHADAVLGALATTRAELSELADPPVPALYAARWEAALAAEAEIGRPLSAASDLAAAPEEAGPVQQDADDHTAAPRPLPGTSDRPDPPTPVAAPSRDPLPQRRPWRRRRIRPALVAAAVLAAAVIGGVLWAPQEPAPPSLDRVDLAAAGLDVRGDFDVGELADPARRAGCLRAAAPPGVSPDALLLGGRDVVVDGRDGVLLLLAGGGPGRLQVVVVEPGCGPDGGVLLGAQTLSG